MMISETNLAHLLSELSRINVVDAFPGHAYFFLIIRIVNWVAGGKIRCRAGSEICFVLENSSYILSSAGVLIVHNNSCNVSGYRNTTFRFKRRLKDDLSGQKVV